MAEFLANAFQVRGEDGTFKDVLALRGKDGKTPTVEEIKPIVETVFDEHKDEFVTPTPYEEVTVTEQILEPSTFYDFGECAELYIECAEPTDTNILNEYMGCFDSGETPTDFAFDMGITWNNNIETKANAHYEFSIIYTTNGYFGLIVETEMVAE